MEQGRPQEEQLFSTEEPTEENLQPDFAPAEKPAKTPAERLAEVDAELEEAFEKPNFPDAQIQVLQMEKQRLEKELGIVE